MKQIVQNYKQKTLTLEELPAPNANRGSVIVQSYHSLISAGTEKMKVDDAQKSYLALARSKPEQFKQVLKTLKQQGPMATYRKVMNRLDSFTPLGYSLAGKVIDKGEGVTEFEIGDMVACAGAGNASHAEINSIPQNLCAKIPEKADGTLLGTDQACFTTVGAISMQGIRQAEAVVGENVAVIGLGLVGIVAALILKSAGCNVIGIDIDPKKVALAKELGIDMTANPKENDVAQMALSFSGGYGVDKVIMASSSSNNGPIEMAIEIARERAIISNVGMNKLDIPWKVPFEKELQFKMSRSYGPGRYDPEYEMKGRDYPIGYVRFTEKRNMEAFLKLMANGAIDLSRLITHSYPFEKALDAYALIEGESKAFYVGIVLEYDTSDENLKKSRTSSVKLIESGKHEKVNLGLIGAGNFARTMLLPHLDKGVSKISVATSTGITAKDTARKFGFSTCATDYRELLADENIDTVMIVTRHNQHAPMVASAINAGKNVYVEKPLAIDEKSLELVEKAWDERKSDTKLFIGYNRRFAPQVIEIKKFFDGRTGPMVMHYRVNAGFMDKKEWYQQADVGGGRIIGEACHFIDTFSYLTGALPKAVFASAISTEDSSVTPADNSIITIEFDDGSIGSISYLANGDPMFPKEYIDIFCDGSVALLDNFNSVQTTRNGKTKKSKSMAQDKGHKAEMEIMLKTIQDGTGQPISFESICATTRATFAVHKSIDTKTRVEL